MSDGGPDSGQGGARGRRARIRGTAGAVSGGAAGGAKHVANVPGQQCLERFDGIGGGKPLEQMGQVCGSVKAIGAARADQGEQICARAGTERVVRKEPYPAPLGEAADEVLDIVVVCRNIPVVARKNLSHAAASRYS